MPKANILQFGNRGMNGNADPRLIGAEQYSKGVNVALRRQCSSTRHRIKVHELTGVDISSLNVQGACFYNPSRGQSYRGFGGDFSCIALAAGGRKFLIIPGDSFKIGEITDSKPQDENWMTCGLFQAENYLIAQQPSDNTWIYNGKGDARWSAGLSVTDKEASEISNGASAGAYVFNRIHQVVNGRAILVGDIIHKSDYSNASNILRDTEQVYWATGSQFSPPSEWDEITALSPIMQLGGSNEFSLLAAHSPSGVMSLATSTYPRSNWANTKMTGFLSIGAGAMGQNCVLNMMEGDQIFRSRNGIQSLKLIKSQSGELGAPIRQLGEEVNEYLSSDSEPLLRYCSMAKDEKARRIYCTTAPMMDGNRWMHRGILAMNLLPSATRDLTPAWEGLITLPDEVKYPAMMVTGDFDRSRRTFCFCYGTDGKLRLAELTAEEGPDMIGCVPSPVPSKVITRAFTGDYPLFKKTFAAIGVRFSGIAGKLEWKVEFRTDASPNWSTLTDDSGATFAKCDSSKPFLDFKPGTAGTRYAIPADKNLAAWLQVKVSWVGSAIMDGVWVDYKTFDPNADSTEFDGVCQSIQAESCDGDFSHSL